MFILIKYTNILPNNYFDLNMNVRKYSLTNPSNFDIEIVWTPSDVLGHFVHEHNAQAHYRSFKSALSCYFLITLRWLPIVL